MTHDVPPGQPEYLDSHGGRPLAPQKGRRRGRIAAIGGVAALAVAGGAAWAAMSFFSTGAQPAEALPASTLGYLSVDLDPSGGQKIEALQTLRKFPAFKEAVGLDADDDVREAIFDEISEESGCDLDYADDVEPWLGNRFAMAAVDLGEDDPAPVLAVQVTDADAADAGWEKIIECAGEDEDLGGWVVADGWALVAEDQKTAEAVAEEAGEASLADDGDFQRWTEKAGGAGIVAGYAAPEVGALLAELGDPLGMTAGSAGTSVCEAVPVDELEDDFSGDCVEQTYVEDVANDELPAELVEQFKEFEGAAMAIRFADGGLELEVAGDYGALGTAEGVATGDDAGRVVGSLPSTTVAALGVSIGEDWVRPLVDQLEKLDALDGLSAEEAITELGAELGLDLPADAETLTGDGFALGLDADANFTGMFGGEDPEGIGLKILGDGDAIESVLEKLRAAAGAPIGILESDAGDDAVAIGPDADYRQELLEDGGLGDTDRFRDVVERADEAGSVLYVDFDGANDWLAELADGDEEARENLKPLAALGVSSWQDGDVAHMVLKVTTD